jgi:hypothetical protein
MPKLMCSMTATMRHSVMVAHVQDAEQGREGGGDGEMKEQE